MEGKGYKIVSKQIEKNIEFDKEINDRNFKNYNFIHVNGKAVKFIRCDFSYSIIEYGYFHQAEFVDCKFIGTTFINSNFRSSKFIRCDFKYVLFSKTILPYEEIFLNLPEWPNIKKELLQNLKANTIEMGNFDNISKITEYEFRAEQEHYKKARKKDSSYYKVKYEKKRMKIWTISIVNWVGYYVWGHGNSIYKFLRFNLVLFIVMSFIVLSSNISESNSLVSIFDILLKSIAKTSSIFIDYNYQNNLKIIELITVFIIIYRYIFWSMIVNMIFQRGLRK